MNFSFKRITSSGNFIPEIDGLRFIAIASVVLYHLNGFLQVKDTNKYSDTVNYSVLNNILSHGHIGVPLFFVISGFILGLPFAKSQLGGGEINLKEYFIRRLTRLEPPYVLTMTVLLFATVYVAKKMSLIEGITSYLASITYTHNFFFPGILPKLNAVTWSLELEIQFYILAPVLAYIFAVKSSKSRLMIFTTAILFFLFINNYFEFKYVSLINYIHYFLIGFILVDLYLNDNHFVPKTKFDNWIALFLFSIIWLYDKSDFATNATSMSWELIQVVSICMFYYYVLFHKSFRILSLATITNIGGMCYTIYLLHYPIISMIGNPLMKIKVSNFTFINTMFYTSILLFFVTIVSALFFLLIERPCMDKDWIKKLFRKETKSG